MSFVLDIVDGKTQNDFDFYSVTNGVGDTNSFVAQVGDLKVTQSASPGLSVLVATGRVYLYVGSKLSYFGALLNAATTLTIGSNSSGSTRIDIICVKFDTGATSNTAGDNVVSLQVVAGTPGSGVPATPANYYKIAEVSVINGAAGPTHIVNADITDKRNWLTQALQVAQYTQIATPGNPASGANKLYFKSDGNPYMLNSSGTEAQINAVTGSVIGITTSISGSTTANSMQPVTGSVTIVTTKTMNIDISGALQCYSNPAGAWGESVLAQLTYTFNGGSVTNLGSIPQVMLTTGNPRLQVPLGGQISAAAAGTYVFSAQFRTANTNLVTVEAGWIKAVALL